MMISKSKKDKIIKKIQIRLCISNGKNLKVMMNLRINAKNPLDQLKYEDISADHSLLSFERRNQLIKINTPSFFLPLSSTNHLLSFIFIPTSN